MKENGCRGGNGEEIYLVKRPLIRRRPPPIQHPRPRKNLAPRTHRQEPLNPSIPTQIQRLEKFDDGSSIRFSLRTSKRNITNQQHALLFK
jgi:hypothetical protein